LPAQQMNNVGQTAFANARVLTGGFMDKPHELMEIIYNYKWLVMEHSISPDVHALFSLVNQKLDEIFDMDNCFVKGCKIKLKNKGGTPTPPLFPFTLTTDGKYTESLHLNTLKDNGAYTDTPAGNSGASRFTTRKYDGETLFQSSKQLKDIAKYAPTLKDIDIRNWKLMGVHNLLYKLVQEIFDEFTPGYEEKVEFWDSRSIAWFSGEKTQDQVTWYRVPKSMKDKHAADRLTTVGIAYEFERMQRNVEKARELPELGARHFWALNENLKKIHFSTRRANFHASWTRAEDLDSGTGEMAFYKCNYAFGECVCRFYPQGTIDFGIENVKNARLALCSPTAADDTDLTESDCSGGKIWNDCGSPCQKTCSRQNPVCLEVCSPKCECPPDKPFWISTNVTHEGYCTAKCVNINKCDRKPCENGGICKLDSYSEPVCSCQPHFTGDRCQNVPIQCDTIDDVNMILGKRDSNGICICGKNRCTSDTGLWCKDGGCKHLLQIAYSSPTKMEEKQAVKHFWESTYTC